MAYPGYNPRISELISQQGMALANARLAQGEARARSLSEIGQIAASLPSQIQRSRAEEAARKELQLTQRLFQQYRLDDGSPDVDTIANALEQAGAITSANEVRKQGLEFRAKRAGIAKDTAAADQSAQAMTLAQDKAKRDQQTFDQQQSDRTKNQEREAAVKAILAKYGSAEQPIRDWTAPINELTQAGFTQEASQLAQLTHTLKPEDDEVAVTVPGPGGRPVRKLVKKGQLREGVVEYVPPTSTSNEPLMAIIGSDGQAVYVPRSQAVGKRPANMREQGRPVVSGDAGRIADLDTSLNDLKTLRETVAPIDPTTGRVKPGVTGAQAQIGAALPAWVTDVTGAGTEAKQKQAVIDRVKQVIGKSLEEGVLRKEDELKYEKILPTIKDTAEVVRTKLDGLEKAITQRRQTTLDALEDAGYDVSRFRARGGGNNKASDPLGIRKGGGG